MAAVIGIFESQYLKNKKLTVVNPGNQKRDFTHIDDIVGGCYLAWKKGRQDDYLICSHKEYSILQVAKMFKRPIIFIPKRPVGGLDNILDLTLSEPELLNPNLFINASSSSSLKTLGLGLPYCLRGVTVPASTKPNPSLNNEL